jgi:hypothetical protein
MFTAHSRLGQLLKAKVPARKKIKCEIKKLYQNERREAVRSLARRGRSRQYQVRQGVLNAASGILIALLNLRFNSRFKYPWINSPLNTNVIDAKKPRTRRGFL